jgi:hypothetical protein
MYSLAHPPFFSMDGIVIDTEGRVSEPLGCGDDQIVGGGNLHRYQESRLGKDLGLLPEIV